MRFLIYFSLLFQAAVAQINVVTPYPLLADCARVVGGEEVDVTLLNSDNVHSFSPTSSQLAQLVAADCILLMGKDLEGSWLTDLRNSVEDRTRILLVGDYVPELAVDANGAHANCAHHSHGQTDPHWWHSIRCWQVAVGVLVDEFAEMLPQSEADFAARAGAFHDRLSDLKTKYGRSFTRIPRGKRYLAVPHAAYAYLCDEFSLRQIPLLGLDNSGEISARHLERCVNQIQSQGIPALFGEVGTSNSGIQQVAELTQLPIAGDLFADGDESQDLTVVSFLEHNLNLIAEGLQN